jgi:hypothetical protein
MKKQNIIPYDEFNSFMGTFYELNYCYSPLEIMTSLKEEEERIKDNGDNIIILDKILLDTYSEYKKKTQKDLGQ